MTASCPCCHATPCPTSRAARLARTILQSSIDDQRAGLEQLEGAVRSRGLHARSIVGAGAASIDAAQEVAQFGLLSKVRAGGRREMRAAHLVGGKYRDHADDRRSRGDFANRTDSRMLSAA